MTKHYMYGGSTWGRTLQCPAWGKFCHDNNLKSTAGEAAKRGTELHNDIEYAINWKVPLENVQHDYHPEVAKAYEQLLSKIDINEGNFDVEHTFEYSENIGGTVDFYRHTELEPSTQYGFYCLDILDFKFGRIPVAADNNSQLLFYAALLAWEKYYQSHPRFNLPQLIINLYIIQPTVYDKPQIATVTEQELYPHLNTIITLDKQIKTNKTLEFNEGSECKYCPAMGYCPKTKVDLSPLTHVQAVDGEILKTIPDYQALQNIKTTIKNFEDRLTTQIGSGGTISGFGLKPKRGTKRYSDEDEVKRIIIENELEGIAYDEKIKTPAQLKKSCEEHDVKFKDLFEDHIISVSSGMTLCADNKVKIKEDDKLTKLKKIFGENKNVK